MSSKKLTETNVNNEDIIDELTKDLKSTLIDSKSNNESSTSSQSNSEHDLNEQCNDSASTDHPDFKIHNDKSENKNKNNVEFNVHNFDKDDDEKKDDDDDDTDEIELLILDIEATASPSEKEDRRIQAEKMKNDGNAKFKIEKYEESIDLYTDGLRLCPLLFKKERAVLYSNRAASKMKLDKNKSAIKDCSKAIEYDPTYIKAYYRRAQCYELTDSLDESLLDFKKILELEPQHPEARKAVIRLPPLIEERNERTKTEMLSKLKDLGNLVLKPFGLSTQNFKLTQDPETKGYSINFQQNN